MRRLLLLAFVPAVLLGVRPAAQEPAQKPSQRPEQARSSARDTPIRTAPDSVLCNGPIPFSTSRPPNELAAAAASSGVATLTVRAIVTP